MIRWTKIAREKKNSNKNGIFFFSMDLIKKKYLDSHISAENNFTELQKSDIISDRKIAKCKTAENM